jgi:hypothetical protein
MEATIFSGIQASGKTTFYKERFFKTHIRLSLDLLNTRGKENAFLQTCFETQQRFVWIIQMLQKRKVRNILKRQNSTTLN